MENPSKLFVACKPKHNKKNQIFCWCSNSFPNFELRFLWSIQMCRVSTFGNTEKSLQQWISTEIFIQFRWRKKTEWKNPWKKLEWYEKFMRRKCFFYDRTWDDVREESEKTQIQNVLCCRNIVQISNLYLPHFTFIFHPHPRRTRVSVLSPNFHSHFSACRLNLSISPTFAGVGTIKLSSSSSDISILLQNNFSVLFSSLQNWKSENFHEPGRGLKNVGKRQPANGREYCQIFIHKVNDLIIAWRSLWAGKWGKWCDRVCQSEFSWQFSQSVDVHFLRCLRKIKSNIMWKVKSKIWLWNSILNDSIELDVVKKCKTK